jgi:hypothetical protein
MDARTGERHLPAMPPNTAGVRQPILSGKLRPSEGGVAVDEAAPVWDGSLAPSATPPRLSVDPMRATDRYRLVMPYAERV